MAFAFMDNIKNDEYYVAKIANDVDSIIRYVGDLSYEDFLENELLIDATMFRLIQMAENIKGLSEDFKRKHPSVPWGSMIGFRNGIVHDYGKTDYSIVYEIVTKDMSKLKEELTGKPCVK